VARGRLSSVIVADYLRVIGSGEMEPGSVLPAESALCDTYGVGRSVVREALQALDAKGFIIVRQGSVATVAPRFKWHILDADFLSVHSGEEFFSQLQIAREVLEPQLASLAALNADDEAIERMGELNRQLATSPQSAEQHAKLDIDFHEVLAFASGNSILATFHSSLTSLGERTRHASASIPGAIERALGWHERILEAVVARDSVAASAAMTLHLRQVHSEIEHLDLGEPERHHGTGPST
jgi:DNA-binding FadR family transcriptional regulator